MKWTVQTPSGYRLTMLPPGVSEGAETNPDCYRIAWHSGRRSRPLIFDGPITPTRYLRGGAPLGLKKGVFYDSQATKMDA